MATSSPQNKFVHVLYDVFVLLEIDDFDTRLLVSESKSRWDAIDPNDTRGALQLSPARGALANRSQTLSTSINVLATST
jgi:hypothetical protein